MPYVNKKRPYKKEYQQQKARNEKKARLPVPEPVEK